MGTCARTAPAAPTPTPTSATSTSSATCTRRSGRSSAEEASDCRRVADRFRARVNERCLCIFVYITVSDGRLFKRRRLELIYPRRKDSPKTERQVVHCLHCPRKIQSV